MKSSVVLQRPKGLKDRRRKVSSLNFYYPSLTSAVLYVLVGVVAYVYMRDTTVILMLVSVTACETLQLYSRWWV